MPFNASADGLTAGEAAMAEPLAVACMRQRAGEMLGKRVLVTGCGPIGVLSILAARRAGQRRSTTDLSDFTLSLASSAANQVANSSRNPMRSPPIRRTREPSTSSMNAPGLPPLSLAGSRRSGARDHRQLGIRGDMALPMLTITAKELDLRGAFRFHE